MFIDIKFRFWYLFFVQFWGRRRDKLYPPLILQIIIILYFWVHLFSPKWQNCLLFDIWRGKSKTVQPDVSILNNSPKIWIIIFFKSIVEQERCTDVQSSISENFAFQATTTSECLRCLADRSQQRISSHLPGEIAKGQLYSRKGQFYSWNSIENVMTESPFLELDFFFLTGCHFLWGGTTNEIRHRMPPPCRSITKVEIDYSWRLVCKSSPLKPHKRYP